MGEIRLLDKLMSCCRNCCWAEDGTVLGCLLNDVAVARYDLGWV